MDYPIGILLPDEQDKHMEKESDCGLSGGGQRATTKEERKWGYRNALRTGEKKVERFYVYSALEDFMDEKPMMPFKMKLSNGKKIPAIFIDYYIPKRDWNFITEEQRKFVQMVYDFKDGLIWKLVKANTT